MIRTAKTENGIVRGLPSSDWRVTAYKGVPYAEPPVGKNRWRAPMPLKEHWEGVRDCIEYAPIAFQDVPGLGTDIYCKEWSVDSKVPMSEDCLYLDIWTPARTNEEKFPVLLWIHGGAYQWGYAHEMEFEGDRLARRGIVVVSVTYRLAAFGFMAHPDLTKEAPEAPANFGVLDQQAALKWVVRNIAGFGGDPDKITIGGQSAGGGSVLSQIACEDNYKDIKGAAVFSGIIRNPYVYDKFFIPGPLSEAEALGVEFLRDLGVSTIEEARELDAEYIREKYAAFRESHIMMSVCIDGHFCKGEPLARIANNECADIPILAGNTTDEFPAAIPVNSEEEAKAILIEKLGEDVLNFKESLVKSDYGYGYINALEPGIKATFESRALNGSDKNMFYYRFDPDIPGEDNPGTFHSVDLWFWFETLMKSYRRFYGRHYELANQMCSYFANFVKTGDPNGCEIGGEKLPLWKPYTADSLNEQYMGSEGAKAIVENDERMRYYVKSQLKEFE